MSSCDHLECVLAPDQPLGAVDGVLRVGDHLVLGHPADQEVALARERDHRGQDRGCRDRWGPSWGCGCAPRRPACWSCPGRSRRCAVCRPWGSSPRLYAGSLPPPTLRPGGFLDERPPAVTMARCRGPSPRRLCPSRVRRLRRHAPQVSPCRRPSTNPRSRATRLQVSRPGGGWSPPRGDCSGRPPSAGPDRPSRTTAAGWSSACTPASESRSPAPPGRETTG